MHARHFDQTISRCRSSGASDRAEADIQTARLCHFELYGRQHCCKQSNKRGSGTMELSHSIATISFGKDNNNISRLNIDPREIGL